MTEFNIRHMNIELFHKDFGNKDYYSYTVSIFLLIPYMVNAKIQNVQARFGQDQVLCKTGRNKTNFSAIQLHTIGRIKSILNIVWVSESLKETLSLIYKIDTNCKNQKPNKAKTKKIHFLGFC